MKFKKSKCLNKIIKMCWNKAEDLYLSNSRPLTPLSGVSLFESNSNKNKSKQNTLSLKCLNVQQTKPVTFVNSDDDADDCIIISPTPSPSQSPSSTSSKSSTTSNQSCSFSCSSSNSINISKIKNKLFDDFKGESKIYE